MDELDAARRNAALRDAITSMYDNVEHAAQGAAQLHASLLTLLAILKPLRDAVRWDPREN